MTKYRISIGAIAIFLAIPIIASTAAAADEYAGIRKVGVISAIGDSFHVSKVGFTVFGNSGYTFPISAWGLDAIVAQQVTDAIKNRFAVKPIAADPSPIEQTKDGEDLGTFVRSLPAGNAVDAYVVVYKFRCSEQCAGTPFALSGLGLAHHDGLFGHQDNLLYAFYGVAVVDAKNGKTIDYGTGNLGGGVLGLNMPYAEADASVWAEALDALQPSQKETLKAEMIGLIQQSLSNALTNAKLTANGL